MTQLSASDMLPKGVADLQTQFQSIMRSQEWQQAPVAKLMLEFSAMIGELIKVLVIDPLSAQKMQNMLKSQLVCKFD